MNSDSPKTTTTTPAPSPAASPILGLTDGMSETAIQLRFAGFSEAKHREASKEANEHSYQISKEIKAVDLSRQEKFAAAADVRQRNLTLVEKTYQQGLRAVKGNRDAAVAMVERNHEADRTTARQSAEKLAAPLNAKVTAKIGEINIALSTALAEAQAEMAPIMEKARARRLAAEAVRKAKVEALVAAAKVDEGALAGATDAELAAAAAVEGTA